VTDKEWLREYITQYRKRINIPFTVNQRVEYVEAEWLDLLKEAGCVEICIGLNVGIRIVRNEILNRKMTNDEIINACHLIKEKKFHLRTYNLFGIPGGLLRLIGKRLNLILLVIQMSP